MSIGERVTGAAGVCGTVVADGETTGLLLVLPTLRLSLVLTCGATGALRDWICCAGLGTVPPAAAAPGGVVVPTVAGTAVPASTVAICCAVGLATPVEMSCW